MQIHFVILLGIIYSVHCSHIKECIHDEPNYNSNTYACQCPSGTFIQSIEGRYQTNGEYYIYCYFTGEDRGECFATPYAMSHNPIIVQIVCGTGGPAEICNVTQVSDNCVEIQCPGSSAVICNGTQGPPGEFCNVTQIDNCTEINCPTTSAIICNGTDVEETCCGFKKITYEPKTCEEQDCTDTFHCSNSEDFIIAAYPQQKTEDSSCYVTYDDNTNFGSTTCQGLSVGDEIVAICMPDGDNYLKDCDTCEKNSIIIREFTNSGCNGDSITFACEAEELPLFASSNGDVEECAIDQNGQVTCECADATLFQVVCIVDEGTIITKCTQENCESDQVIIEQTTDVACEEIISCSTGYVISSLSGTQNGNNLPCNVIDANNAQCACNNEYDAFAVCVPNDGTYATNNFCNCPCDCELNCCLTKNIYEVERTCQEQNCADRFTCTDSSDTIIAIYPQGTVTPIEDASCFINFASDTIVHFATCRGLVDEDKVLLKCMPRGDEYLENCDDNICDTTSVTPMTDSFRCNIDGATTIFTCEPPNIAVFGAVSTVGATPGNIKWFINHPNQIFFRCEEGDTLDYFLEAVCINENFVADCTDSSCIQKDILTVIISDVPCDDTFSCQPNQEILSISGIQDPDPLTCKINIEDEGECECTGNFDGDIICMENDGEYAIENCCECTENDCRQLSTFRVIHEIDNQLFTRSSRFPEDFTTPMTVSCGLDAKVDGVIGFVSEPGNQFGFAGPITYQGAIIEEDNLNTATCVFDNFNTANNANADLKCIVYCMPNNGEYASSCSGCDVHIN